MLPTNRPLPSGSLSAMATPSAVKSSPVPWLMAASCVNTSGAPLPKLRSVAPATHGDSRR